MEETNSNSVQHPSFGLMSISRISLGNGHPMCGTDLQPDNLIRITINRNCVQENDPHLGRRVYKSGGSFKDRVEVEMTFSQFSTMICSLNMGEGTPCNIINYGPDGEIEPFVDKIPSDYESAFEYAKSELKNQAARYANARKKISGLIEKLPKSRQEEIMKVITSLERDITDSVPFFMNQMAEASSEIVSRAKNEIAHYMDVAVHMTGMKALNRDSSQNNCRLLTTDLDSLD